MNPRMPPLPESADAKMRAAFWEWVRDQGCDTDGAWSAWQAAWSIRWNAAIEAAAEEAEALRSNEKAANMTARELITNDAAEEIASAIRSLKEPDHE